MKIALATCRELPDLDPDDHPYVAALKERGVALSFPIWDLPHDVAGVDAVVVRSTWDYSEQRDSFVSWAQQTEQKTTLLNPAPMIRWNTDKQLYLEDLAGQGVPTVPTVWAPRNGDAVDVAAAARARSWSRVVIKPIVGAGSRDTIAIDPQDPRAQAFLDEQRKNQGVMVQPFLPGIANGEVSLIFLGGRYSHAVVKKPKTGDFRSQPEFGSAVARHTPTTQERSLADHALHIAGGFPLYARVDLVEGPHDWMLIELEMVEPCLYLGWSDSAAGAFADATLARVASVAGGAGR